MSNQSPGINCEILDALSKACHTISKSKGFYDGEKGEPSNAEVAKRLMLIVTEVSEACEAHRKENYGLLEKDTFEDEIADILIRVFDLCGWMNIDIGKQVKWKMEHNSNREKMHGKVY